MKNKESQLLQEVSEEETEERKAREETRKAFEEENSGARRMGAAIFLLVVLLFAAVIGLSDLTEILIGRRFGESAGTAAGTGIMIVLAFLIAGILYRKEIMNRLRGKRKEEDEA